MDLVIHVHHLQHEGRAGKWKRVKLFKENVLANAPQKNIHEKNKKCKAWTFVAQKTSAYIIFFRPHRVINQCAFTDPFMSSQEAVLKRYNVIVLHHPEPNI